MNRIELLAPAKNLTQGVAAIDHGADAVYIGAPHHGARSAACNTVEDIKQLVLYAHKYMAKVYVTLNTIVYDDELSSVVELLNQLAEAQIDALLVQDMGIVNIIAHAREDEPLSYFWGRLHASTQTDNRTAQKVEWLRDAGFSRAVLARELSIDEIAAIHKQCPDIELEAFVHGALCVSYSGLCYASQCCFGRSANRGECAQFCRMKFSLVDSQGRTVCPEQHLLSLKDMCQIENLENLLEAGVVSFKIEGRLKDEAYVKNVVAAYSKELDRIIARHPNAYCRSSLGQCKYTFDPDLYKTFNRGYTTYFANGRRNNISCPDTPKAKGKMVGHVKEIRRNSFSVAGIERFANGDGLCFVGDDKELHGFRVNRVEGGRIFPLNMPQGLAPGMALYRNSDKLFEDMLARTSAERKIMVDMRLETTADGLALDLETEQDLSVCTTININLEAAQRPQEDNMKVQLSKLGNTQFSAKNIVIAPSVAAMFVPSSKLAELRRQAIGELENEIISKIEVKDENPELFNTEHDKPNKSYLPYHPEQAYQYNIANREARAFYSCHGLVSPTPAYELSHRSDARIMQCRFCLRFALGHCVRNGGEKPTWTEPLYLVLGDGRRFRLEFACQQCQMNIYAENK